MADFPGKVSTQTSSQEPQRSYGIPSSVDIDFIKGIPGILLLAEIVVGLLVWALIASTPLSSASAYVWVMLVSVTLWLLSIALLVVLLLRFHQSLPSIPWPLVLMVFYSVAAVLYLTAFLANAASVPWLYRGYLGTSAFFAIVVTLLYAASSYFAYLGWRGEGQNAAGSTVPV
ncbi:plasmolipin [Pimephales promelas]|uniref:plasmolipin n=1 Tax=Pimephales promelas TaxID=90988 RepID=UPI0019554BD6|nr:plasmolipin [Pimephales promelas]XP_039548948.1 plasmolipin [Pimephales promelas]XP_039548949.1 plasmolipin [Pimephales promelas]KAG1963805.1 CKLF-like MARVEL transmembrane domain-containing protein [Pimephales promelas]KAG1963806.1 CKLF-like MARVEL transmembrane domain-containing protein [Pimephales promelas]KAG1963807.1 CKLF-like MARVEL transmembrane domain-containing protein [Pimephales promelas]KAG1963808.1 CKLF-like MARVEL transmembrane domain-containing protein [Pimephales promelas]